MNRKELVRAYKEAARPMGVYRIHNSHDDKSFVGSSVDLPSILNRQRSQLKFGGHRNTALQRDWATLGPEAFVFEVLDTLTPPEGKPNYDPRDDLRTLEAMWVDRLQPFDDRGYMTRPKPRP